MISTEKIGTLALIALFAVACGETPTEAPDVPLTPSLDKKPENPGADVVNNSGCGVYLYPVVKPEDNPPTMYVRVSDANNVRTPSGNRLFRCKAQLPDWAQPPDRTVVWRGGNCGPGTTHYHKVFTPSGEINLTCGFK